MSSPVACLYQSTFRPGVAAILATGLVMEVPGCAATVSERFVHKEYSDPVAQTRESAKTDSTDIL